MNFNDEMVYWFMTNIKPHATLQDYMDWLKKVSQLDLYDGNFTINQKIEIMEGMVKFKLEQV